MNSRPQLRKNSRAMKVEDSDRSILLYEFKLVGIAFVLRLVPNSTGVIVMVASNLNTVRAFT